MNSNYSFTTYSEYLIILNLKKQEINQLQKDIKSKTRILEEKKAKRLKDYAYNYRRSLISFLIPLAYLFWGSVIIGWDLRQVMVGGVRQVLDGIILLTVPVLWVLWQFFSDRVYNKLFLKDVSFEKDLLYFKKTLLETIVVRSATTLIASFFVFCIPVIIYSLSLHTFDDRRSEFHRFLGDYVPPSLFINLDTLNIRYQHDLYHFLEARSGIVSITIDRTILMCPEAHPQQLDASYFSITPYIIDYVDLKDLTLNGLPLNYLELAKLPSLWKITVRLIHNRGKTCEFTKNLPEKIGNAIVEYY